VTEEQRRGLEARVDALEAALGDARTDDDLLDLLVAARDMRRDLDTAGAGADLRHRVGTVWSRAQDRLVASHPGAPAAGMTAVSAPAAPDATQRCGAPSPVAVLDEPEPPARSAVPAREPPPAASSARTLTILSIVFTMLGVVALLFVVYQVFVTDLLFDRAQHVKLNEFKAQLRKEAGVGAAGGAADAPSGVLTGGNEQPDQSERAAPRPPKRGEPIAVMTIPRLRAEWVVVEGSGATETMKGPGHVRSTPMPGERGNVAIIGRRSTYGSPFAHIDRLRRGDRIRLVTQRGVFTYVVSDRRVVGDGPTTPDPLAPAAANRLTLVTTTPAYLAVKREVVVADLRGSPIAPPPITDRGGTIDDDEDGITWNRGAVPALLLWAQLLVLALIAAWVLYRRWLRWPTYLITTPVLLALLLLVFDSASAVFPSGL
jgi:sortase A